jgi:hypothetical protein
MRIHDKMDQLRLVGPRANLHGIKRKYCM